MDLFNCTYSLEAKHLKPHLEHFPLSRSLHSAVLDKYAPEHSVDEAGLALDEILDYLKKIDNFELPTLEAILEQTEAIGDPGLPSGEQIALINWFEAALSHWEEHYPVEEPLASEFKKLRPLAAALAITDPTFSTPGAHSFHLLMDTIGLSLVGWHSHLGRAGQNLERMVRDTTATMAALLEGDAVVLKTIYETILATTTKDRGRAQRMSQRIAEAELGRLKTSLAKEQAAQMINTAMQRHQVPITIGTFLKGPWFESAQLVLLRYGVESAQWAGMAKTTEDFLNSFQSRATTDTEVSAEPTQRQLLFEVITNLPREIKRYLLSLQHDEGAVSEALGVIELAHMSVLRQTELELVTVDPIAEEVKTTDSGNAETASIISDLEIGQWFSLRDMGNGALRMQLALKIDDAQQLLFTNNAGLRERQESYSDFASMLSDGTSVPLFYENSFSRSLLHVVEGSTEEEVCSTAETTGNDAEELLSEPAAKPEQTKPVQSPVVQEPAGEAEQGNEIPQEPEPEQNSEAQRQQDAEKQRQLQRERDDQFLHEQAETLRKLREQAEAKRLQREKEAAEQFRQEEYLHRKRERDRKRSRAEDTHTPEATNEFKLPIGAWIGFHDGNSPLMAKLATYEAEQDNYIFVDRVGKRLREVSGEEMRSLMGQSLVEVLQTRSTFREDVHRERNKNKD